MKQYYPGIGLDKLCRLFGYSRQAYYDYLNFTSERAMQEALALDMVKEIRALMPRIGSLKLHHMITDPLKEHRIHIGRDRFCALLRANDMLVKPGKRYYVRTTDSNHHFKKWPDLTVGLTVSTPHQLWVSDITYLRSRNGFLYLSLITDAFSRKIIGHHLSHTLSAKGCISALNQAIAQLPSGSAVTHHSDRGIQYCCEPYVALLQSKGIAISMTQDGSPYENALAERINGILKTELGLKDTFDNYGAALRAVNTAIDTYNRIRPHLSLAKNTPQIIHDSPSFLPINPKPPRTKPVKPQLYKSDAL